MATGTDYDTRRTAKDADTDADTDSGFVGRLTVRRNDADSSVIDVDETEAAVLAEGAYADPDLANELTGPVLAQQNDEFTCSRCFLIVHRRRYARTLRSKPVCRDCS